MKVVTLEEAIASGKPFRNATKMTNPESHALKSGHIWRIGTEALSKRPDSIPTCVKCTECQLVCHVLKSVPNKWVIWKDEDEFEKDAANILNNLGVKIRQPERVGV